MELVEYVRLRNKQTKYPSLWDDSYATSEIPHLQYLSFSAVTTNMSTQST